MVLREKIIENKTDRDNYLKLRAIIFKFSVVFFKLFYVFSIPLGFLRWKMRYTR